MKFDDIISNEIYYENDIGVYNIVSEIDNLYYLICKKHIAENNELYNELDMLYQDYLSAR